MKVKITKKTKQELKKLIDQHGYWSDEVREYISQFHYPTAIKLQEKAQVYNKYKYGL